MNIGFIVEQRYLRQEMPRAAIDLLQARGVSVGVIRADDGWFDAARGVFRTEMAGEFDLNRYDVIVSRNRNALGLAMLAYAEAAGIPAVNTHAATERVRNKAHMAVALERAGVPCAPTLLASEVSELATLPAWWFPLVLKATYGDNSQGLRLARRPDDLWDVHWPEPLVLAQHYVPNAGYDLKLYVCGEHVFATRKPSPFNRDPEAMSHPVQPDRGMIELALRCGRAFGLEIYGVDTVEGPDGVAVIEVNEFPNFTAVTGAAAYVAELILGRAESALAPALAAPDVAV